MSRLILVLGCHRSGTSLAAKSLECLGAELGDNAEWYGRDQPDSFSEDRDILALDERLLHYLGSHWADPEPLAGFERLARWQLPAGPLLRHKLARWPVFALKEPRLCRLQVFWKQVFADIGCYVSVVHVVRDPLEVAASLLVRNGLARDAAFALWLEYTTCQFRDADPLWPAITVRFDQLIGEPRHTVRRIGAALNLPVNEARLEQFASQFVRPRRVSPLFAYMPPAIAEAWARLWERAR